MAKYADDDSVRFVVYYTREPHARQLAFGDIAQPKTYDERTLLAQKTCAELQLDVDTWIDDLGDTSRATFGDLPNPAIVIDPQGKVRLKLPWCDAAVLAKVLPEIQREQTASKPVPADAGFLAAIGKPVLAAHDDPHANHHREVMLAWLVAHEPQHADRTQWLDELAKHGPPQQQAWVEQQRAVLRPKPATAPGPERGHDH